jgi:hypothetical protein
LLWLFWSEVSRTIYLGWSQTSQVARIVSWAEPLMLSSELILLLNSLPN